MEPSEPGVPKKRRGCLRGCLLTLLVLIGILLLTGGGLAFLITRTPTVAKKMTPVPVTADAAASFDAKIQEAELLFSESLQQPIRVEITQDEVTARLVQELERRELPIPISHFQVNLKKDMMQISAILKVNGLNVPVVATAEALIEGNEAVVEIKDIQIGSFPVPSFVRDQINDLIKKEAEGLKFELPQGVKSISIEEGMIVLEGF
ncbi:MAG: hypothetical protein HY664_06260 [Chloroflexi bacterium]|nr:hypothetical protein [Chloroflexota bacterium]